MIGPSSEGSLASTEEDLVQVDEEAPSVKKRLFEELYEESFGCQNVAKRYLQEVGEPVELVATSEVIDEDSHSFAPASAQADNCQVARLEVLLVDGTGCTWTTLSELEDQQGFPAAASSFECSSLSSDSPSSLSSSYSCTPGKDLLQEEIQIIHEMSYQGGQDYWNPGGIDAAPSSSFQSPANKRIDQLCNPVQISQQQQYDDQETGNLSWLLDFKLDPFIEAADDRATIPPLKNNCNKPKLGRAYSAAAYNGQDFKRSCSNNNVEAGVFLEAHQTRYSNPEERNPGSSRCGSPKKPPFTYTELIEHALQEKGELTVSAIYQWISERYPYYKSNDDRWKNSVRHNLSINPHFRKGSKAPHGAGHLWAIANRSEMRPRPFLSSTSIPRTTKFLSDEPRPPRSSDQGQMSAVDEVEMATASIMQPQEEQVDLTNTSVTLEHCAGQILSGVKKQVEVQYLVPMTIANSHEPVQTQQPQTELHYPLKESDFLNPVSKEVLAEECGLISEGYLVTELNPASLGLNLVDPELISPENLFGEELNFQFYELASPSQIQSA